MARDKKAEGGFIAGPFTGTLDANDKPEFIVPAGATVRVRFLVRDAPWDAGEVVDLEPAQAEKLIQHGVAEEA